MATKNQLYALGVIKKFLGKEFKGDLKNHEEVSKFISLHYEKAKKEMNDMNEYFRSENLYASVVND